MNSIATGAYTGTAAALNIQLGFLPDYVLVWNETDGDEKWEWFRGMTNGHALKTASGAVSKITSNGVSEYGGVAAGAALGFTVGTALSESGKTFRYLATRAAD